MYSSTEPALASAAYQYQPAKENASAPSDYAFLSNPPKQRKHKPQPISTRCPPPRSLPRTVSSRRRPSISGSPAFQASFITLTPTPTSETPKTPHLTSYGYTAAFATLPRRGSAPHVQEALIDQARRVPASIKSTSPRSAPSSPKRVSPKRRHHRVPSSPFASPSPTRTRACVDSTTRIPLPEPFPPPSIRTSKLSKIRSLANLRARSPSPAPPSRVISGMATLARNPPKVIGKRTKRSATPARGSAAFAKYRPMPFIQQMQMIQFLEGGSLDSHIRRHHVHAGQVTAHTGFATGGKEEIAHGYSFTDERGMIWFDEEEEWEFASLLPQTRPQRCRGIKRLLGKQRDDVSDDEWEDFEEEGDEPEKDVNSEVLLARDDDLLAREDDLVSFGGALEGAWARGHSNKSVLKLPPSQTDGKRKRAGHITSSIPAPQSAPISPTTRNPSERAAALKKEFLATAFAPPHVRTSRSTQAHCAPSPFRMFTRATTSMDDNASRTLFQHHHRAARSVPNANVAPVVESFVSFGTSLRGGDVLDAKECVSVPRSPTVQWAGVEDELLSHVSSGAPATETRHRTQSPSSNREGRFNSVFPPPAAARRLGIEPSTTVSLQPFADLTRKQTLRNIKGFKSARGN